VESYQACEGITRKAMVMQSIKLWNSTQGNGDAEQQALELCEGIPRKAMVMQSIKLWNSTQGNGDAEHQALEFHARQ
jgi:hypothetical protein